LNGGVSFGAGAAKAPSANACKRTNVVDFMAADLRSVMQLEDKEIVIVK
jgi:hypothetical protein